ncbi:putative Sel1-like repeat-containing protein [Cotonvirus japonicus]|uniref:Sel1-like repeat-containing protein n=1 Tax=Cotonvirus japonicus TaxID=2811091 RepID=A0ABM7NQZ0_9VIRU|nr:putative Sel1-like repeat-containing protein [Cotonvirus japonicus]BCS82571.1 putative Sel1-like repeat-containing protein [Cotonvirus japonicus]
MYKNCDKCDLILYSDIYHQCSKIITKIDTSNIIEPIKDIVNYKILTIDELGILADKNDHQAQNEIVYRYLNQNASSLPQKYVNPINWNNVVLRAQNDQLFVYFLFLCKKPENQEIYSKIIDNVLILAESGDSQAQCNIGFMYKKGLGINKNIKQAIKWTKRSADQGNKYGQSELAYYYETGYGVSFDIKKAIELYTNASNQNYTSASRALAYLYRTSVYYDILKSAKIYEQEALKGNCVAQFALGMRYRFGEGVVRNDDLAIYWITMAADQGLIMAKNCLASMYKKGICVSRNHKKALEILTSIIHFDHKNTKLILASLYKYSLYGKQDIAMSMSLFMQSEESHKINKYFQINTLSIINAININDDDSHDDDIDYLESQILCNIHTFIIKIKYNINVLDEINMEILQDLEKKFMKFVYLRDELNNSSAMITCLSLRNQHYSTTINNKQLKHNETPCFKQHVINNICYLSFSKENVLLADKFSNKINKNKYMTIINNLNTLNKLFEIIREKIMDDVIDSIKTKNFDIQNNLIERYDFIKLILFEIRQLSVYLNKYFDSFVKEIANNVSHRNLKFQQEHPFIFG